MEDKSKSTPEVEVQIRQEGGMRARDAHFEGGADSWLALAKKIALWRDSKGFITPSGIDTGMVIWLSEADAMLGKLMLVTTEIAEAAEAVRHGDAANFREELADAVIRILDICGTCGIDLKKEVEEKMMVNESRPALHGKATKL
jgi:hypothetical protein